MMGTGTTWERIGRRLWPALSGVHLVESGKSLIAAVPQPTKIRGERAFAPARANP
jgi:hypothetical protein